jgi:hypothetical protein
MADTHKYFQRIAAQIERSLPVSANREWCNVRVLLLVENALTIPDLPPTVVAYLRSILAMWLPESDLDGLHPKLAQMIREAYSHAQPDPHRAYREAFEHPKAQLRIVK